MNIFYFVKRWPRENFSAQADKILSLTETLVNLRKHVFLVSADKASDESLSELKRLPIEVVHVN